MMSVIELCSTSGLRSMSARRGIAARSSARTLRSEPLPARPMGVRIASTITASGIQTPSWGSGARTIVRARVRPSLEVEAADAELVEADVVRELVADGAHDLLAKQLGVVPEVAPERVAEDDDAVVDIAARGAVALIEAVRALAAAAVGDHDGDMRERVAQEVGKVVERVAHELFEVVVVERVELEEVAFVGVVCEPFARELLGVADDLLELALGLGVAPAGEAHGDEGDERGERGGDDDAERYVLERADGTDGREAVGDDDDD